MKKETTKVNIENFKNRDYFTISDKPFFMTGKAFIQTNMALSNLEVKLAKARKEGKDSVEILPEEKSALMLYSTTYASKESDIGQFREYLVQCTKEKENPLIISLPSDIGKINEIQGIDIDALFEKALKEIKDFEVKTTEAKSEINQEFEKFKLVFLEAREMTNMHNPYNKKEIDFLFNKLKDYLDVKMKGLNKEDKDAVREVYKDAYSIITNQIHRTSRLYVNLLKGNTTIAEELIPENDTEVFRKMNNAIAMVSEIRKVFDKDFHFGVFKDEIVDPIKSAYANKDPQKLKESLEEILSDSLQNVQKFLKDQESPAQPAQEEIENEEEERENNSLDIGF